MTATETFTRAPHVAVRRATPILPRILQRLVRADAQHRDACRLADLPRERREDMGLPSGPDTETPSIPDTLRYSW